MGPPITRTTVRVTRRTVPSLAIERTLWAEGADVVVGVDEVGRGAWAGPISVGAAVLPRDRRVYKIRDSKLLTEAERERIYDRVAGWCRAWAVGHASQAECDDLGMSAAQKLAAQRALDGLGVEPDEILVDGSWDFVGAGRARRVVKGDATCLSIATASILAKVTRDRIMRAEAQHYPLYDFEYNKGYPCPRHKLALKAWGPSAIHRRTWVFMDHLPWWRTTAITAPADQLAFDLA
jgi:ribonuclease HII